MVYIKCRREDEKRFSFLTSKGGTTYLKIHAAQFEREDAVLFIAELAADNPDFEFRIVQP
jgi:hypothetical protein